MLKTQSKSNIWLIHFLSFFFLSFIYFRWNVEYADSLKFKCIRIQTVFNFLEKLKQHFAWLHQSSSNFSPVDLLSMPIPRFNIFLFFKRFFKNEIECTNCWWVFKKYMVRYHESKKKKKIQKTCHNNTYTSFRNYRLPNTK